MTASALYMSGVISESTIARRAPAITTPVTTALCLQTMEQYVMRFTSLLFLNLSISRSVNFFRSGLESLHPGYQRLTCLFSPLLIDRLIEVAHILAHKLLRPG